MAIQTGLPSRYEVRTLGPEHVEWACAILTHSNVYYSAIFAKLQPDNQTRQCYAVFKALNHLIQHQIDSGHSLGVFDNDYQLKRTESIATSGKLHWDDSDEGADSDKLLEQMDFPLVSVALAYDGFNGFDMSQMESLMTCWPSFGTIHHGLVSLDQRDPASWQPNSLGEVLFRAGTSTRHEYERNGIMKLTAQYMMRVAAEKGYRGIQIETVSDPVYNAWINPPAPFRSELASVLHTSTYEVENEKNEKERPLAAANQEVAKIYCHLK